MSDRCHAADCGRVHDIEYLGGAFESEPFCAYHRGKLEAGESVACRNGDTAWDDEYVGLMLLPPAWKPCTQTPTRKAGRT